MFRLILGLIASLYGGAVGGGSAFLSKGRSGNVLVRSAYGFGAGIF